MRWAAREAFRRNLPLQVVHVFDGQWREARYDTGSGYPDFAREHAEGVTATAVFEARVAAARVEVEGDPLIGHPAAGLLAEADGAELMVLGSRGRGGFQSLMLGSVSQRVATHASCPVVVVRGRGDATDGPVAVGVDDSPSAEHVLEVAFGEAVGRACGLVAVRSYLPVLPLWSANVRPADVETPEADADERVRLEEQLAPWRAKYPDVSVEVLLTHESVASALVEASTHAQLVVVGSRGRGMITGALLGSTGLQLLHHAECPVYIARTPEHEHG